MRPPEYEQAGLPLDDERPASGSIRRTNSLPEATRRPRNKSLTQYERVLAVLLERDEVCGSELYAMYIPRFGAHLHRMKRRGYGWTKRPCDRSGHNHEGTQWLYRLESLPFDPSDGAS